MKNLSTFLLLLCLSYGSLAAQQVFVLYEPGCMLRVQYEHAIARQPKMDFFSYQVPLADGNKIVLETGVEGNVRQNYLPPDYMRCNDARLNAELVERINGNATKVFMLVPDGTDYLIQPVTMGAVLARQNNLITYVSPLASFQFDTRNVIIGENLSYNNPNAKVFFEGREGNNCTGTFMLRQLMPRNAYPVIDYRIIPEVGVVERRLGSDGEASIGGVTVARSINGQPLDAYIAALCGSGVAGNTPNPNPYYNPPSQPTTYGGAGVANPTPYSPPNSNPASVNTNPAATVPATPAPAEATMHTVVKGETLYGLGRRYGVNVDQIREWNNLNSNTIAVGQELRMSAPGLTTGAQANRAPVTNTAAGAPEPVPYFTGVTSPTPPATPADQNHIVQPGETVASVALKYGFTEAKFREINGLGANEYIRIGQRLKTDGCNCPTSATAPTMAGNQKAAPQSYGSGVVSPQNYVAPAATPQGTPIGPTSSTYRAPQGYQSNATNYVPQPQAYGSPATTSTQPYSGGTTSTTAGVRPYGGTTASNPAPNTYNRGAVAPQNNQPAPVSITNDPAAFSPQSAVIPRMFQAPAAQSMNSLEGTTPRIGGSQIGTPATYGQPVTNAQPATSRAVHVVQEGESLYGIAQRYGLTVDQLRQLNGLSRADLIIPFQRLYIN